MESASLQAKVREQLKHIGFSIAGLEQ
jgi:hypothetical protein